MKKTPYLRSKQSHLGKFVLMWTIFLFILMLGACTKTTPIDAIVGAANDALTEVKDTLSPQCQTKEVFGKIDKVQALINTAPKTCELQVQNMRLQRNSYALGFFSMIVLAILVFVRRIARL